MHLDIHDHAKADLEKIWQTDPEAAAELFVLMEILEDDPRAHEKLLAHGLLNIDGKTLNSKRWIGVGREINLWRLQIADFPASKYRIIYGYHWETKQLCTLAIVNRKEYDYDKHDSDINRRIFADWHTICRG